MLIAHPHQGPPIRTRWSLWSREEVTLNPTRANYINHVAILLDASGSMNGREDDVIKAVDNQIKYLARRSTELDQETRVSIYTFADRLMLKCVIFDKDVLRLPSIAGFYHTGGRTALIDATFKSIEDLEQTAIMYGDHSFLIFAFTDGQENASHRFDHQLSQRLTNLPDNWTVAALVPTINAKLDAQRFGFPKGNISIWDVSALDGVNEAMTELQQATDNYMVMRSTGQSGTKQLFSTDATAVNAATIAAAGLQPLAKDKYVLVPVTAPKRARNEGTLNKDNHLVWEITDFVKNVNGGVYKIGSAYYELSKQEKIGGNKSLAVLEIDTGKVFVGDGVRAMIGLPDEDKRVAPTFNDKYRIFVQSQSPNRHLVAHTKLLILK